MNKACNSPTRLVETKARSSGIFKDKNLTSIGSNGARVKTLRTLGKYHDGISTLDSAYNFLYKPECIQIQPLTGQTQRVRRSG